MHPPRHRFWHGMGAVIQELLEGVGSETLGVFHIGEL